MIPSLGNCSRKAATISALARLIGHRHGSLFPFQETSNGVAYTSKSTCPARCTAAMALASSCSSIFGFPIAFCPSDVPTTPKLHTIALSPLRVCLGGCPMRFMMNKMTCLRPVTLCFPRTGTTPPCQRTCSTPDRFCAATTFQCARSICRRDFASPPALCPRLCGAAKRETYLSASAYATAGQQVDDALLAVSLRYGCEYGFPALRFPSVDIEQASRRRCKWVCLCRAIPRCRSFSAPFRRWSKTIRFYIAVALVHPDQLPQTLVLGRLLRAAGYRGFLCMYGAHEDVLSPRICSTILCPPRTAAAPFFADFDGAIIGKLKPRFGPCNNGAVCRSIAGWGAEPAGAKTRCRGAAVARSGISAGLAGAGLSLVDGTLYPYPEPLVDVRMSRGCPWNCCTFCAITMHQEGYRALPVAEVSQALIAAHKQLGASFFRFRDDLLTPKQLLQLSLVASQLPFAIRFSVRSRFEPDLTADVLAAAHAAGLEEIWLGLESAVPRVRT